MENNDVSSIIHAWSILVYSSHTKLRRRTYSAATSFSPSIHCISGGDYITKKQIAHWHISFQKAGRDHSAALDTGKSTNRLRDATNVVEYGTLVGWRKVLVAFRTYRMCLRRSDPHQQV